MRNLNVNWKKKKKLWKNKWRNVWSWSEATIYFVFHFFKLFLMKIFKLVYLFWLLRYLKNEVFDNASFQFERCLFYFKIFIVSKMIRIRGIIFIFYLIINVKKASKTFILSHFPRVTIKQSYLYHFQLYYHLCNFILHKIWRI